MQGHIAVEAVLLLLLFVMFVQRAYKPGHKFAEDLTEKVCCRPRHLGAEWGGSRCPRRHVPPLSSIRWTCLSGPVQLALYSLRSPNYIG